MDAIKQMADRYRRYILGLVYIPIQDLGRYKKAFNQIYGK